MSAKAHRRYGNVWLPANLCAKNALQEFRQTRQIITRKEAQIFLPPELVADVRAQQEEPRLFTFGD